MREYLSKFFEEFDYPEEARGALLSAYDALHERRDWAARFEEILGRYEKDINCDFNAMLEDVERLCEEAGVNVYTGKLTLCLCMSRALKAYYRRDGVDEKIWFTCMCDLKYKLMECRLVQGVWGSFVCGWFVRFFNATRFGFEKLQFELISFDDEYEKNGVKLSADSSVINVHIPRTGDRLDKESMERAFEQAAAFFKERYGLDRIVFVCSSWLLYPRNLEALSENSNLRRFISCFDVYKAGEYDNYDDVWRLFDQKYEGDADALPQNTSLRRAYADWIRRGIKTGWGRGVYVYKV